MSTITPMNAVDAMATWQDEADGLDFSQPGCSDVPNEQLMQWIRRAAAVCQSAGRGDLEPRLLHIDADGDLRDMLQGSNRLLDLTDAFVRESTAALEFASQGKFFRRVLTAGMLGSFQRAAESINGATAQMQHNEDELHAAERRRAELADEIRASMDGFRDLSEATNRIASFSNAIGRIAAQTDILAVNASIEAARAGDVDAGFAVVATEVKKLAGETKAATQDIREQLASIQRATGAASDSIERIWSTISSQQQAESASAQAAQAG